MLLFFAGRLLSDAGTLLGCLTLSTLTLIIMIVLSVLSISSVAIVSAITSSSATSSSSTSLTIAALSPTLAILVVAVKATTLAKVTHGRQLELPQSFIVVEHHVDLVGQLQCQRLNPRGLRPVHDNRSRGLIQGSHQLLVDDHLTNLTVHSGRLNVKHLSQHVNGDGVVDEAVRLKIELIYKLKSAQKTYL